MDQNTLRLVKYINHQLNQLHGNRKEFVMLLENIGERKREREKQVKTKMSRFEQDLWSMF
jgi:hypothetical protein